MDVSVIMINYNTYELTKNALNSIFKYTSDILYEIILIDNNSPDLSGEKLKNEYAEKVTFIQNVTNEGTSKAFNKGLALASGKYVLWLNTDVLLFDNFIKKLFDYMEKDSGCGICGGNVLDVDKQPAHSFKKELITLKTIRKENNVLSKVFNSFFRHKKYDQFNFTNSAIKVGYVTGADMMIRKSVIDKIGGFDERFFMYAEEVEFTYRMKRKTDFTAVITPDARIIHLEGASSFNNTDVLNTRKLELILNGNTMYFYICFGKAEAIRYLNYMIKITNQKKILSFLMKEKKNYYKKYIETIKKVKQNFIAY